MRGTLRKVNRVIIIDSNWGRPLWMGQMCKASLRRCNLCRDHKEAALWFSEQKEEHAKALREGDWHICRTRRKSGLRGW